MSVSQCQGWSSLKWLANLWNHTHCTRIQKENEGGEEEKNCNLKFKKMKDIFYNLISKIHVATDMSPIAAGGYFCVDWYYHHFVSDSPVWDSLHINNKEALAIGLAAKWWNRLWSDPHIIIYSDNQAAVQMINKGMTAYTLIMQDLAFGNLQFPHHHCLCRGHP